MATKTKREPSPLGRRLPQKDWGKKDFWLKSQIEGRRRKRIAAALDYIEHVADEMVKWGYDVELKQVEDQVPTLMIRDRAHYRSTAAIRFRPPVPEVGGYPQWDPKIAVQAADLWDDIFHIGDYAERLRLMGRRLFDAMKRKDW
jgi:hypothetical protein